VENIAMTVILVLLTFLAFIVIDYLLTRKQVSDQVAAPSRQPATSSS